MKRILTVVFSFLFCISAVGTGPSVAAAALDNGEASAGWAAPAEAAAHHSNEGAAALAAEAASPAEAAPPVGAAPPANEAVEEAAPPLAAEAPASADDAPGAQDAQGAQDRPAMSALANADAPLPSGSYVIRPAVSSIRVLDVEGANGRQGARLIIWPSQTQQNQIFRITADTSGYYSISSALSGQLLDVEGGQARNGAGLVQWPQKPSGSNANQLWQIVSHDDGSYSFLSALALPSDSHPGLALDISGAADANGVPAVVWQYHASINQRFYLVATDRPNAGPSSADVADGIYSISPEGNPSLLLDISQASVANGATAILWPANDGLNQLFRLTRQPDGYHAIISVNSGMALDVFQANVVPGTAIIQWPWKGSDNQEWSISEDTEGSYRILSKHSGLPLDTLGSWTRPNTALYLGRPAVSPGQHFKLSPTNNSDRLPASLLNKCCVISPSADRSRQLDVSGASYDDGAAVLAWPSHSAANQRFELLQATAGTYALRSAHSGRYLTDTGSRLVQSAIGPELPSDAAMLWQARLIVGGYMLINLGSGNALSYGAGGGAGASGGTLGTSEQQDSIYQAFVLSQSPVLFSGTYRLNTPGGMRLDFSQNGSAPGAAVYLWTGHNNSNQKFRLQAVGGTVVLRSPVFNTALDIEGASGAESARAIVWSYSAAANQRFLIVPSGDGWYYLQAGFAPYPYLSASADISGATVHVTNDASRAQRFRFEPASLSSSDIANNAASSLHSASGGRWISSFGGYSISPAASASLQNAINGFSARGWDVGLIMVDLNTGKGLAYNADWDCYSASSIKGPYVASLAAQNPALLGGNTASVMERTITVSDNNAYASLRSSFGAAPIQNWCRQVGVDANKLSDWYVNYSARDLGLLWTRNYEYFFGSAAYHEQLRSWYRSPLNSPIANTVGRHYESYSKPGWHFTMGRNSTNDAGIVFAPNGCYLLAVMTNAPAQFGSVHSLVWALDTIHNEM